MFSIIQYHPFCKILSREQETLRLHDFDMIRILVVELGQIDHQTGEQVLTRALRRLRQPAGQPQGA